MEIKFRVRLKSKNNTRELIIYYTLESLINGQMWDKNLYTHEILGSFTGLKDRNGEGIYEGDILKVDFNRKGGHESVQVVEFYEGAFGSRNKEDHFRIPALFSGRATEGMNLNYYEVIGNIHENPELIP